MFKIRLLIPFPEGSVPLTIFPIIANGILILPSAQVKIRESSWVFTFSYTLHCIHEKIFMVLPLKSIQNLTLLTTSTATWVWTTITPSLIYSSTSQLCSWRVSKIPMPKPYLRRIKWECLRGRARAHSVFFWNSDHRTIQPHSFQWLLIS